jgi:hypothetical protein
MADTINGIWSEFDSQTYLREYYSKVDAENTALIYFFAQEFSAIDHYPRMLDFGCGPTIYQLIAAAAKVREIHICDYLERNLDQVRYWLQEKDEAWDWRPFIGISLERETNKLPSAGDIDQRQRLIRQKVTRTMRCDAGQRSPLFEKTSPYDLVTSTFCAESATHERKTWQRYTHNISSLLRSGGILLMTALKGSNYYSIGDSKVPATNIHEEDLRRQLINVGFADTSIHLVSVSSMPWRYEYDGLMMARAVKM